MACLLQPHLHESIIIVIIDPFFLAVQMLRESVGIDVELLLLGDRQSYYLLRPSAFFFVHWTTLNERSDHLVGLSFEFLRLIFA